MNKLTRSYQSLSADVKFVCKTPLHQGHFAMTAYQLQFRTFAGAWSPTIQRELVEGYEVACGLLFDPNTEQVVLIEQFRIGTLAAEHGPWSMEIISGIIDAGETAEQALVREAREEAGVDIKNQRKINAYWCSPGMSSERVHLFIAEVDATKAGGIHGAIDEHEDIKVHVVDYERALTALAVGEIDNAPSIIALQWLQLHYAEIRSAWA